MSIPASAILTLSLFALLALPARAAFTCPGDCDGSDDVTVDEIVLNVNTALGTADASACPAGDVDADGAVTVDEIVLAIRAGLLGCLAVQPTVTLGEHVSLRFDAGDFDLALLRDDVRLLRLMAGDVQLGAVDAIADATNYDPYPLVAGLSLVRQPTNLRWLSVHTARLVTVEPERIVVDLTFEEGKRATFTLEAARSGSFRARLMPLGESPPVAYFRLRLRASVDEGFYGLGEYFDAVNHRGRIRAMHLYGDASIESTNNEAHVPVPFLIGTTGWGVFVESPYPGAFDVASRRNHRIVEITFGTGAASPDGLDFHFFAADHPLDVTRHYYEVTGYPKLPARWAYGPWIWRDENDDQAQVENDIATIRDLDLATSAYWIDRPYATGVNAFDFNPPQFPEPQAMIDRMHDLGFRVALWHTPYVDEDDPDTAALFNEARDSGYFPVRSSLLLNQWSRPIDFTNPAAYAWWQDNLRTYLDMGIEGFKLDYGEDIIPGIAGLRNVWQFSDGSDERTMHSRYQLFYHRAYAELLPEDGGFLLCRGGTYGTQQFPCVIWPGDLDANLAKHRDEVSDGDGTYVAVGGLPAALIAGLSLAPSGFPFYGSDTGGYRHSPPDKETFTRWFQQTALSTVMQIGTSTNDVAWEPTPANGFDAEMLDWYRIYTRLHLRLFPYAWSYAERLAEDGRPIMRALGLAHPELGVHPDDIYLFGDDLLVAPVVMREQREREVVFPPGDWIDWWTGEQLVGGQTLLVDAPLSKLPLYQRAGSVIPLLRPTIDTLSPTSVPEQVDSYATTPGVLYARVVPGAASVFSVYDRTQIGQALRGAEIEVTYSPGEEFRHGALVEIHPFRDAPDTIALDGEEALPEQDSLESLEQSPLGWTWDGAGQGKLYVKIPAAGGTVSATTTAPEIQP